MDLLASRCHFSALQIKINQRSSVNSFFMENTSLENNSQTRSENLSQKVEKKAVHATKLSLRVARLELCSSNRKKINNEKKLSST